MIDALGSLGVSRACPACGSDKRVLAEAEGLEPSVPLYDAGQPSVTVRALLPVYLLQCENCGFVQAFVKGVVDRADAVNHGQ